MGDATTTNQYRSYAGGGVPAGPHGDPDFACTRRGMSASSASVPVKVSSINLATLVGCVALVAAVAVWAPGRPGPSSRAALNPLSALPAGAAFVVTANLSQLRRSDLGAGLAGAGREVPGLGRLEAVCGFDPTSQIERLAVALPHSPENGAGGDADFGVAATGRFNAARLVECARVIITRRGGNPVVSRLGSFVSVRDRTGHSTGEIAIREAGLVLVGGGPYLRNMIDAADGTIPSLRRDELHRTLRRAVGTDGALVATWVPPARWLERWLGLDESVDTPWAHVRAAGMKLDLTTGLGARVVLHCANPDACQQIAHALESLRSDLAVPASRAAPLAAMVKRTRIESAHRNVRVQLRLTADELALLLDAARALLGWGTAPAPSPSIPSAPRPDEVVRPPVLPQPNQNPARPRVSAVAETETGPPRPEPPPAAEAAPASPSAAAGPAPDAQGLH